MVGVAPRLLGVLYSMSRYAPSAITPRKHSRLRRAPQHSVPAPFSKVRQAPEISIAVLVGGNGCVGSNGSVGCNGCVSCNGCVGCNGSVGCNGCVGCNGFVGCNGSVGSNGCVGCQIKTTAAPPLSKVRISPKCRHHPSVAAPTGRNAAHTHAHATPGPALCCLLGRAEGKAGSGHGSVAVLSHRVGIVLGIVP